MAINISLPQLNMKLEGAIFDMDGTLIDSLPIWARCGHWFCDFIGIPYTEEVRNTFTWSSGHDFAEYAATRYNLPHPAEYYQRALQQYLIQAFSTEVELMPGVKDTLLTLHAHGVKLAICTASHESLVKAALGRHGILDLFTCIDSSPTIPDDIKHGPDYIRALEGLSVSKCNSLVFEDTPSAIREAVSAGFTVCAYMNSSSSELDPDSLREAAWRFDNWNSVPERLIL